MTRPNPDGLDVLRFVLRYADEIRRRGHLTDDEQDELALEARAAIPLENARVEEEDDECSVK